MSLRLTICRDYAENGQPIVVIGVLVPPFVNPTVFQTEVVAAMLTALGVTSADIVVDSGDGEDERMYVDLSNRNN